MTRRAAKLGVPRFAAFIALRWTQKLAANSSGGHAHSQIHFGPPRGLWDTSRARPFLALSPALVARATPNAVAAQIGAWRPPPSLTNGRLARVNRSGLASYPRKH